MDVFLSVLPSHYMVSDEAVARFKESHRIAWLNEQLSLGDTTSAQSPIFKATAGPMPTEMELATKVEDDATEVNTSDLDAAARSTGTVAAEPDCTGAPIPSASAPHATEHQDKKQEDGDGHEKGAVESMVLTATADETIASAANPGDTVEGPQDVSSAPTAPAAVGDPAPIASDSTNHHKDVGDAVESLVADVSSVALANAQAMKRSREDMGAETISKRMRENEPVSSNDTSNTQ